jgi:hypothetical protein
VMGNFYCLSVAGCRFAMRARCKEVAQGRSYSCAEICEAWLLLDGA